MHPNKCRRMMYRDDRATRLDVVYGVLNLFACTVLLFHHVCVCVCSSLSFSFSFSYSLSLSHFLLVNPSSPPSRGCRQWRQGRRLTPVQASLSAAMPVYLRVPHYPFTTSDQ